MLGREWLLYFMNKTAIPIGLLLGALSWGVVSLVSDVFEPFDSFLGFYIGQCILSVAAIYYGYRHGFSALLIYLGSAYIGMNAYAYIFGSSESRAWLLLGLLTTFVLSLNFWCGWENSFLCEIEVCQM